MDDSSALDGGRYEFDELNMPRARYSRVYGSVQLFVLNSNRVTARQTAWLESRLAASTATWKLVAFHHPAYTCGGYLGNPAVQRLWVPLFQRYDVDLALSGHDHNYQRFAARRGVRYVVHGGGGRRQLAAAIRAGGAHPQRARSLRRQLAQLAVGLGDHPAGVL